MLEFASIQQVPHGTLPADSPFARSIFLCEGQQLVFKPDTNVAQEKKNSTVVQ